MTQLAKLQLVAAHIGVLVGWCVLAAASVFFWVFVAHSDLVSERRFRGDIRSTEATVENVALRGRRGEAVHVDFTYTVAGERHSARSYATSRASIPKDTIAEYPAERPQSARLRGLDAHAFSGGLYFALGVACVGLLGLTSLAAGTVAGLRNGGFFQRAQLAYGRLVEDRPAHKDGKSQMRSLRFEYVPASHDPADPNAPRWRSLFIVSAKEAQRLSDDAEEPMLYDPDQPERAMTIDNLECGVALGTNGRVRARPAALAIGVALPLVVLVLNGVAALVTGAL